MIISGSGEKDVFLAGRKMHGIPERSGGKPTEQTEIKPVIILLITTENQQAIRGHVCLLMIVSVETAANIHSFSL